MFIDPQNLGRPELLPPALEVDLRIGELLDFDAVAQETEFRAIEPLPPIVRPLTSN